MFEGKNGEEAPKVRVLFDVQKYPLFRHHAIP